MSKALGNIVIYYEFILYTLVMPEQVIPEIKDLLKESNASIDEIFKEAFDSFEQAQRRLDRLDKLRNGVAVRTPTPAAESDARVMVTQGEGSHEVRVHRRLRKE